MKGMELGSCSFKKNMKGTRGSRCKVKLETKNGAVAIHCKKSKEKLGTIC